MKLCLGTEVSQNVLLCPDKTDDNADKCCVCSCESRSFVFNNTGCSEDFTMFVLKIQSVSEWSSVSDLKVPHAPQIPSQH